MKKIKEFKPNKELVAFANDFSENYEMLSAGDYFSGKEKYHIMYGVFKEAKTGKRIHTTNPARVNANTGVIELNREIWLSQKRYTPDFLFLMILWCVSVRKTKKYMESDLSTLKYYIKTDRSKKAADIGWLTVFKNASGHSVENQKRYIEIRKILLGKKTKRPKKLVEKKESKKK